MMLESDLNLYYNGHDMNEIVLNTGKALYIINLNESSIRPAEIGDIAENYKERFIQTRSYEYPIIYGKVKRILNDSKVKVI